ncbi:MAG: hypothetical protein MUQ61_00185, partial [OM182 bacterium]|nr:hypothetical protein [OM182 bacterium]
ISTLNSNYKKINQQGENPWSDNAFNHSFYRSYFHSQLYLLAPQALPPLQLPLPTASGISL